MEKKIALVTGGNRGIGNGIVHGLAEKGFYVFMGCRDTSAAKKALNGKSKSIEPINLDVVDEHSIIKAKAFIEGKYGVLDVLVNNAGVTGKNKSSFKDADLHEIKRIMEVNYYGPMRLNSAFLDLLKESEGARIINMSSVMGSLDDLSGAYAGYRLSKAGLNTQSILLANDLKDENIKVFVMHPGWVRTDMGGPNATTSVEEAAANAIWLATDDKVETGKFYHNRQVIPW